MKASIIGFIFLLSPTLMAAGHALSTPDSLSLINEAIFPLIKNEMITEEGKQYSVQTRGLQTSDELLSFSCSQKYYAGMQVNASCIASISTIAKVHEGNRLQTGVAGSLRATIGWPDDVSKFGKAFQNVGTCRPDVVTQLYVSQERKEIVFPNGKKIQAPLLTVGCYGDGIHHKLTQLIVTIFPK